MPNKHEVTLPDGSIAKRTSQNRVYTHCVAYRPSFDYALAQAAKVHPFMVSNHKYYVACAKGEHEHARVGNAPEEWQKQHAADVRAKAEAYVAEYGEDLHAAMTKQTAEAVARVYEAKDDGYFDDWKIEGWNGRLDLAQKAAASARNRESIAEVRILETNFA